MATLLDAADRAALVQRLRQVTPERERRWGTMSAAQMLCHVSDQMRVALGEISGRDRTTLLRRTLFKWIALTAPFPRGIKTAREMLTSRPGDWAGDLAACETLIESVGMGGAVAPHPVFGPMSPRQWGRLCWKHLDYHLRQFGG